MRKTLLCSAILTVLGFSSSLSTWEGGKKLIIETVAAARTELAQLEDAVTNGDASTAHHIMEQLKAQLTTIEEAASKLPNDPGSSTLVPRDGKNEVSGHTTTVIATIAPELYKDKTREIWIAVIPERAPSSMWVQGQKLTKPENSCVIYVGRPDAADRGWYKVVLITAPKGAISKEGEILVSKVGDLGIEEHAFLNLQRNQ